MAQNKSKTNEKRDLATQFGPRLKEGAFIALVALAIYLTRALASFDEGDPGWTYTGSGETVKNLVGRSGAWVSDVFLFFFGYMAYLFPMILAWRAWIIFLERESATDFNWPAFTFRGLGLGLTIVAGTAIAAMHFYYIGDNYQYGSGGVIGSEVADLLVPVFSYIGSTLILLAMFLFGYAFPKKLCHLV